MMKTKTRTKNRNVDVDNLELYCLYAFIDGVCYLVKDHYKYSDPWDAKWKIVGNYSKEPKRLYKGYFYYVYE